MEIDENESSVRYTLTLPLSLLKRVDKFAKETERNRASAMRYLIKEALEWEGD